MYFPGSEVSILRIKASHTPPGRKFRHAAYNIDTCRGEAESPKTRFTWPAWRSNYFPGINLYYYIVPGGELCGVALGVYGGKGVNMWRSVNFMCVANFRPAVAGIPGVAVLVCASKRGARTDVHPECPLPQDESSPHT